MLIAIVGKPGSGKSTVFSAITGISGLHRVSERHGTVLVPDERLDYLHKTYHPDAKKTYVHIEFLDTVKIDFSREELRVADGYLLVVDGFSREPDPEGEIRELKEEMMLKDLEIIEKRLAKLDRAFDQESVREKKILTALKELLDNGKPVSEYGELPDFLRGFNFSSGKPVICVVNSAEGIEEEEKIIEGVPVLYLQGEIEKEISELPLEERDEFYKSMGISEPAAKRIIRIIYKKLGLITFYTMNRKEVRAWSVKDGIDAKTAAGVIHSDMERGFIRAEVISFDDLKTAGSEKKARELGLYRVEGKDYTVRDGDILFIRFSV